jgi:glycerophosphoryl diester phosphodiesterase
VKRFLAALAVAIPLITTATAQAQTDPREIAVRGLLNQFKQYVVHPACDQTADPARWEHVGTPDAGRPHPLISAHRGGNTLAPENTIQAYEYAFALGVPLVEVDVQETKDGHFVSMHDSTVDRTTNGTGDISTLNYDYVRSLNNADYDPWKGSEFDPAQVASLDEILALAQRVGGGIELDIKGSTKDQDRLANLVASYGLLPTSIFNTGDVRVVQAQPGARVIYNKNDFERKQLMYDLASVASVFGSTLAEYDAEDIAAVHDGCGLVMPHAYDAGPDEEVNQFLLARSLGADGVQTNQPEKILVAAGEFVDSRIDATTGRVCLVNKTNGLGFPQKHITVGDTAFTTGRGGCVAIGAQLRGATARFAGEGAVRASSANVPVDTTSGGTVPATLSLTLGAPASFGAFTPGVAHDYTAQTSANVTSTAGDAALSVPAGTLANGAFKLAQPVVVRPENAAWTGPVSNDTFAIGFKQAIGANEALRTGTYSTTLTFTLSTTTP